MLDINYIRENVDLLKKTISDKNIKLDLDELLSIDTKRRELQQKMDALRSEKNKLSSQMKGGKVSQELVTRGKVIKEELEGLSKEFDEVSSKYDELMCYVPIPPAPGTPVGKGEEDNVVVEEVGEKPKFDFEPKEAIELAKNLDILDLERGTKVGGYRGYYLKGAGVQLVMGMMMYALNKMIAKGYSPMIPPTLVKEFVLFGSGYFDGHKYNDEVDNIYQIASRDVEADGKTSGERKFLVGTAEPSLLAYYADEVLDHTQLPMKLCGFSQCYRSEIGSHGRDTKGFYRVHEFMKVEQVVLAKADVEEADKLQQEMIGITREMYNEIGFPYRLLRMCTGEYAPGKYKYFDLEVWSPGAKRWMETGSASNFLDWQARRLNVKYKDADGSKKYVYMLNNTALPTPRPFIAILENFQQADGSVVVPEVLRKYVGIDIIKPR